MMLEVIDQHRMPPWNANPEHGSFKNARHMPQEDIETIRKWVASGMPQGNPEDLPPLPQFVEGWRLPKAPDSIVAMRD